MQSTRGDVAAENAAVSPEVTRKGWSRKWRIKIQESARTSHASAMYRMEKSTAERHVVTREVKTWKSHVSATIRRVHSHFGASHLEVPMTLPPHNDTTAEQYAMMRSRLREN
jgi:hypothetical protein